MSDQWGQSWNYSLTGSYTGRKLIVRVCRYLNSTVEYRKHPYFKFRKYLSKKNVFVFYCGRRYGLAIATIYLSLKLCYIMIGTTLLLCNSYFIKVTEHQVVFFRYRASVLHWHISDWWWFLHLELLYQHFLSLLRDQSHDVSISKSCFHLIFYKNFTRT